MKSWMTGLIGFFLHFASGCNFHQDRAPLAGDSGKAGSDNVSNSSASAFEFLASQLFNSRCASCHNPGVSAAGIQLTSYNAIVKGASRSGEPLVVAGDPEASLLVQVIADGRMPPSGAVDAALLTSLRCWISAGALATGGAECVGTLTSRPPTIPRPVSPQLPPPTSAVHFADLFARVIEPHCLGCHGEENAGEAINLGSYASLMAAQGVFGDDNQLPSEPLVTNGDAAQSLLWRVISSDRMPYFDEPLSTEQKQLVQRWINEGALP